MTQKLKNDQIPQGEDWHIVGTPGEPAFQNGWINHDSSYYPTVAFRKDPYGMVHLRGMPRSGTVDSDIFTLPVGYRPLLNTHTTVSGDDGTAYTTIHIYNDGRVHQRTGNNAWVGLDNIRFSPEQ